MADDRRLIEETFPIKEISDESIYDKRIREGHISVLHPWPARRPLAASIATIYTSLIGFKHEKDLKSKVQKAIRLAKWDNFTKIEVDAEEKTNAVFDSVNIDNKFYPENPTKTEMFCDDKNYNTN